ncbi:MAG: hypothetical protein WC942_09285 [Clostridia bacterium]|jgi:hypothetical protein
MKTITLNSLRHPEYVYSVQDWELWRYTYEGGDEFVNKYLQRFTNRETTDDFNNRRSITPIPTFAKAAINDVRNSIYQRMTDVTRRGGSFNYQQAIAGKDGGVNLQGAGMNAFLGFDVLTELLIMGKVGVYVDNPVIPGGTLADTLGVRPYMYMYQIEDILSWTRSKPNEQSEFQAILLRDRVINYTNPLGHDLGVDVKLPQGDLERYRLVFINPKTGLVNVQFYNKDSQPIDPETNDVSLAPPIELNLTKIPFVLLDIKGSLLKDVCKHQIALLNLCSSDVAYALKSNFPFYVEQQDNRAVGAHLKVGTNAENTASEGGQGGKQNEVQLGVTQGRAYGIGMERPAFISPPSEPLEASIRLQEKLEDDIRKLVNLAVANKTGKPISGESKEMDNQGLEAGLSFIGLILETAERKIAQYWASYENKNTNNREVPIIKYPNRYSLKKDEERIEESDKLSKLMNKIPGNKIKRELSKIIVATLLDGKISVEELEKINREIDLAPYTTSDLETISAALENGLVSEQVASQALGFNAGEYLKAREDHLARITRIAMSQAKNAGAGAEVNQARGVPDFSSDPKEGKEEKKESVDTTLEDTTKKRVRGEGK